MGIFDSTEEHPPAKALRYVITTVVFVALIVLWAGYEFRFHKEEKTVRHFMDDVVAGQLEDAYRMYKPGPSYSFKDFTDDWDHRVTTDQSRAITSNTPKRSSRAPSVPPVW